MQLSDLKGKRVLITGASSGIGAQTALRFARQGAFVGIHFFQNREGANRTLESVQRYSQGIVLQADVKEENEIKNMIDLFADRSGGLDVLVNNAGTIIQRQTIAEAEPAYYDEIFRTNVHSAFLSARFALAWLKKSRGTIINIGSVSGHLGGFQGSGIYATTKGALAVATIAMAKEFYPHGIRVNSVLPGFIDTPFHEGVTSAGLRSKIIEQTPLGRAGTADDIASAILFLASEQASFITGEYLAVNGGLAMRA